MRNTYWHRHPRQFANECDLLRATTAQQGQALYDMGYIRLTLAELRRHVRHVNAENDAWGSNRAFGPINEIASYTEAFEGRA